jgi:hypothetical protein
MFARKLALGFVTVFFVLSPIASAADDVQTIMAGVYENANAWRKFDYLSETQVIDEVPDKELRTIVERERFIADYDKAKLCIVNEREEKTTLLASAQESSSKKVSTRVLVSDEDNLLTRKFPSRTVTRRRDGSKSLPLEILRNMEFNDMRDIVMQKFPPRFGDSDTGFDVSLRAQQVGVGLAGRKFQGKVIELGDKIQVSSEHQIRSAAGLLIPNNPSVVESFVFEKKSFMPIARKVSLRTADNRILPEYSYDMEWQEINGCWMPIRFSAGRESIHKVDNPVQGQPSIVRYDVLYFVRFHWFSVNERIEESRFDKRVVDEIALARELVDPAESGAISLMSASVETRRTKGPK